MARIAIDIIDGVMSDQATDRHARVRLRQAAATGLFDPDRALELGVITPRERDEIGGLRGPARAGEDGSRR